MNVAKSMDKKMDVECTCPVRLRWREDLEAIGTPSPTTSAQNECVTVVVGINVHPLEIISILRARAGEDPVRQKRKQVR
jgi:hypothetical protein